MTTGATETLFADPKLDMPFKKIFGTVEHKNLLIELLNALLVRSGDERIVDLEYLTPEQLPPVDGFKLSVLDVKCLDASGTRYVVEMQVFPVPGFQKRVVLNACKAYVQQLNSGDGYSSLSDVIAVSICNFAFWPESVPMLSRWRMREESSGEPGLSQLSYVFLELPKYGGKKPETAVEKWAYFFRETGHLREVPEELSEPPYTEALEAVRRARFTAAEWDNYEREKMAEEDYVGGLRLARDGGIKQGLELGRKEGQEGRQGTLLTLLEQRFGALSDEVRERVSAAGSEQVDAWTARILSAASLEELLDRR